MCPQIYTVQKRTGGTGWYTIHTNVLDPLTLLEAIAKAYDPDEEFEPNTMDECLYLQCYYKGETIEYRALPMYEFL